MAFMGAMGAGDMVRHNEGDKSMAWIGPWKGKEKIFEFLPIFGENFQTTQWKITDAVFGQMNGITTKSGAEIGEFSFALGAKVRDGQVALWHWFEDSFRQPCVSPLI